MKLAFLYAGQGSQKVGMGKDIYEEYPQVRHFFDNESAGFDIKKLCFDSPIELLSQTRYTQASMAAFAGAVTQLLYENDIRPDYLAGLSLGEYSALYASGAIDEDTLLDLLAFRGKVMEDCSAGKDTKMAAILGLEDEKVARAVERAANEGLGVVACANFNCPGQIVIGGETGAVDLAMKLCKEFGAKRCAALNVSGPFHTPLMNKASLELKERFKKVKFSDMTIPIIFNVTGHPIEEGQTVPGLLEDQVKSPVLFEKSIRYILAQGVETIVEIGPGKTIAGFVKKIDKNIRLYSVEDNESIDTVINQIRGE